MALKVPYDSSVPFLQSLVDNILASVDLRVFQNDYTPVNGSHVGNFTEATFDGYASITLDDFGAAALNADNKAQTEGTLRTWTMTGSVTPNTVYGIYVTIAGPALLYAERNPAGGFLMNTAGLTFSYRPRVTLKSEF